MSPIEVSASPSPTSIAEICDFLSHLEPSQGLSDHLRIDLINGGSPGFVALIDRDASTGTLAGYAQISAGNECEVLGVCADSAESLLLAALEQRQPELPLRWWIHDTPHRHEPVALANGFTLERELIQMRRRLPADRCSGLATRSVNLEQDRDRLVAINNTAFADHGEQGNWTRQDLERRVAEPWFRPDAVRIVDGVTSVEGFCWVKPHLDADPPCGEIYIVAVDPQHQGRGLGSELTRAGLDWMVDHGFTEAMLFVDGNNAAAIGMYERLGFHPSRVDRCYILEAVR